jgi:outer membrane biosynthesis protein TonB
MQDNFESKKNAQAGGYTALVCGLLLIIFFFVRWSLPALPEPPLEEGIEVNLGSSDAGFGTDQPFEPGPPAPAEQQAYTPPAPTPVQEEPAKETPDDNEPDAPEIKKPTVTKPEATKIPEKDVVKSKPVKKPVEAPPAPPVNKPKAVFKGVNGTGTGGNEADTYKKGGNQGIAGGQGDQGRPGGNPNSDNYTGGGKGNGGISVRSGLGNRKITGLPKFTDDFDEAGTVVVSVKFGNNGRPIDVSVVVRGSTTSSAQLKDIALRKARQITINADPNAAEEQIVVFNMVFKLTN